MILELLLNSGGCNNCNSISKPLYKQIRWQNALKIFREIYEENPGLSGVGLKLLVAVCLTFSSPVQGSHNWGSLSIPEFTNDQIDYKSRFKYFYNHLE